MQLELFLWTPIEISKCHLKCRVKSALRNGTSCGSLHHCPLSNDVRLTTVYSCVYNSGSIRSTVLISHNSKCPERESGIDFYTIYGIK